MCLGASGTSPFSSTPAPFMVTSRIWHQTHVNTWDWLSFFNAPDVGKAVNSGWCNVAAGTPQVGLVSPLEAAARNNALMGPPSAVKQPEGSCNLEASWAKCFLLEQWFKPQFNGWMIKSIWNNHESVLWMLGGSSAACQWVRNIVLVSPLQVAVGITVWLLSNGCANKPVLTDKTHLSSQKWDINCSLDSLKSFIL